LTEELKNFLMGVFPNYQEELLKGSSFKKNLHLFFLIKISGMLNSLKGDKVKVSSGEF